MEGNNDTTAAKPDAQEVSYMDASLEKGPARTRDVARANKEGEATAAARPTAMAKMLQAALEKASTTEA